MSEEKKVIMIGGNDQSMAVAVLEALREKAIDATIYELDTDEMKLITDRRLNKVESETVKNYMENEENRKQARTIATQFYEKFKGVQVVVGFMSKSLVKKETSFSWSKFNEVIGTLDLFGFIEWKDASKSEFRFILSEEEILNNKKREIQNVLDHAYGKLAEIQGMYKTKKEQDKIESMKKKMKLTF